MQNYLTRDSIGIQKDFGNPVVAAKFARRIFRQPAEQIVLILDANDKLNNNWVLARDEAYFRAALASEGKVLGASISAATIIQNGRTAKVSAQASSNAYDLAKAGPVARRVRHAKFGEGTVTIESGEAVTVLFDNQKKPVRIVASFLQTI